MDWPFLIETFAKIIGFTFMVIMPLIAYSTYAERRVCAIMQDRVGPNRVGLPLTIFGAKKDLELLRTHPAARGRSQRTLQGGPHSPAHVRKAFYWMAPAFTAVPAFITFA